MHITVIGRGNIGGGLADLWEQAGHKVERLGRSGGDAGGAEAVLVAVPGDAVQPALAAVTGLAGKTVLDATNLYGGVRPPGGFASNAEYIKSVTGGPAAKVFNTNIALLYKRIAQARVRPSNLWSGDEEARGVVEQLSLDAGYEAVRLGDLTMAATQEDLAHSVIAIAQAGLGEFVYRLATPEQL
ncbi:dinucleotide-binding protein [Paractinoplanes abujensis]|uniref:Putative dinucleotide-binding enzyme n=1 Tax=Paractinoplanes abujensis TaxID=882441 RepID=A0A7W7G447_9ACTN|nr:dinucleotide-binding protein [Actinoplanes abujensis]MBB4697013.1 putative dinucleotide-binding enzyme [Actinoplanes abujensis]GID18513.1 dinucleotide-binding protein [Actinoplanes abujensis]